MCFRWKTHKWRKCQLVPWSLRKENPGAQENCGSGLQTRGTPPPEPFLSYIFSITAIESRSALAITVTSGEAHVLLVVFVSILHWSWRRKCLRFSVPASWDSPDSWSSHTARLFVTCGSSHAILIKGPFLEWSRRRCC